MTPAASSSMLRGLDQPAFISLVPEPVGSADGPLGGVQIAVKDNIDVAGLPTTAACPARDQPAAATAPAVQRLVGAGAVVIGKTNMDQFATGLVGTRTPYGACHSVASTAHISGGSSSGSAVAVAAGIVPLALGTDTAGSGRVPAAFNGLVGFKPTRGLVPTTGVLPACPSLDCVTTLTRDVALARTAFEVMIGVDAGDPYSRPMPVALPSGVAQRMQVLAVPDGDLDLDDAHRVAWDAALEHAAKVAHLVPVPIGSFLEAAKLLYTSALVAERFDAFGAQLETDGPHLDPTVRRIVLAGREHPAAAVFAAQRRLAALRAEAMQAFVGADALLLPVTPGHPRLAEVAADPIGVNTRLGTYTNMVNLFDLCAVAVPAGQRPDGLPFGVQLIAPAFADRPLLDLAERWTGGDGAPVRTDGALLAVAGAHLSGQPANGQLVALGGRLHSRTRTAGGYRMYRVPGPFPRPGLVADTTGPAAGLEVEVWELPQHGVGQLLESIAPPLGLGQVQLADGGRVTGFVAAGPPDATAEITGYGGWRGYLASIEG